jgi:hypothetical protein
MQTVRQLSIQLDRTSEEMNEVASNVTQLVEALMAKGQLEHATGLHAASLANAGKAQALREAILELRRMIG